MCRNRSFAHLLLVPLIGIGGLYQVDVRADGWHSPVLEAGSVDQWIGEARAVFPQKQQALAVADFSDASGSSSLRAGRGIEDLKKRANGESSKKKSSQVPPKTKAPPPAGNLQANLNPQQKAFLSQKANDALQILAFMKEGNIYPQEFPRFPIQQMGQFRNAAKQLLNVMGPPGAQAIAGQLRAHLMSGIGNMGDITYHPEYVSDMLDVLSRSAAAGWLTPEDLASLREAMQGQKSAEVQQIADQIEAALPTNLDFLSLLQWATELPDAKRKADLLEILRQRIPYVETADLEQAVSDPKIDGKTKAAIASHLKKSLPELGVIGLLTLISIGDDELQVAVERELRTRNPTYGEIQDEIPSLWEIAKGKDARAAAYANWHVVNAFQRAPMSHCLYWLGKDDDKLNALIWKQVDGRIANADAERKAGYVDTALKAVQLENLDLPTKRVSIELLGRLKDRTAVKPLTELLLTMQRDLWPAAGTALRDITGENFGPQAGDGVAEVTVAVKHWREWAKRNGL
jgi:hypothetical protein